MTNRSAAIGDICATVWGGTSIDSSMGFLTDEKETGFKHFLYRVDNLPVEMSQSRTLNDILSEIRATSLSGTLLKRERLEIATTLASSVLQLLG